MNRSTKLLLCALAIFFAIALRADTNFSSGLARLLGNTGATLDAAPGATPPTNALYTSYRDSTGLAVPVICDKSAQVAAGAAATTQIVALSGSTVIYVCNAWIQGTGAVGTAQFKYGTGSSCGTGTTVLSPAWGTSVAPTTTFSGVFLNFAASSVGYFMKTAAANALCITMVTASATANVYVSYAQF